MGMYFMGIDIGTNEPKGVIMDPTCKIVAKAVAEHETENPKPGYYEHDAQNHPCLQIIADVCGYTVKTAEITLGSAYGDAMIAAIGAGHFADYKDLAAYIKSGYTFIPNKKSMKRIKSISQSMSGCIRLQNR